MLLIYQGVHEEHTRGIIGDTHLNQVFNILNWADDSRPDIAPRQVESWFPDVYWHNVNPVFASLRQLHDESCQNKEMIKVLAKQRGVWSTIKKIVKKV